MTAYHNPFRILVPDANRTRKKPDHCRICDKLTRENKPYCIDHVEHHPYVKELLRKRELESEEIKRLCTNPKQFSLLDTVLFENIKSEIQETVYSYGKPLSTKYFCTRIAGKITKRFEEEQNTELPHPREVIGRCLITKLVRLKILKRKKEPKQKCGHSNARKDELIFDESVIWGE